MRKSDRLPEPDQDGVPQLHRGLYFKPRIDRDLLREHSEGIIALSACLAGEIPRALSQNDYQKAKEAAQFYLDVFGKDHYFIELQNHGIRQQQKILPDLIRLAKELDVGLVATNDCHYTYAEDEKPHDILLCLQTGKKLSDENRMRYEGGQYYVKSEDEMRGLFPYALQALENTQKIADRCHVEIEFGVTKLPRYDVPDGYTSWEYLQKLCFDGLKERYPGSPQELVDRLGYELETIRTWGMWTTS